MRSLFILVAAGCISTAHAGDLRPDPPIFAAEVIQPNGPTDLIMPASQLAYVLGVGLDQRPFRLRFDFAPARLNSPIAAGRLGLEINSPFGADARLIADVGDQAGVSAKRRVDFEAQSAGCDGRIEARGRKVEP